MRILYSHYLNDNRHPAARMADAIAEQLRALGHEVHVHRSRGPATPSAPPAAAGPGRNRRGSRWLRGKTWFLREIGRNRSMLARDSDAIARFAPEIILARQDAYCVSMAIAARRSRIPLVTYADAPAAREVRSYPLEGRWHPPKLVEAIERWTLNRSEAAVTVSRPAAAILADYGLPIPIQVAPNGVHPEQFPERDEASRQADLAELGIPASSPTIFGFQGTFKPFHNLGMLRELIVASRDWRGVHWLLIGDGPERPALESSLRGVPTVTFAGRKPAEEMGRWLTLFDVSVSPHEIRPGAFYFCPLKILESAAAGAVVVAGDQGDVRLWLDDGRAGVILRSQAQDDWVNALRRLADSPQARRDLGEAARRYVLGHLTWRHTAIHVEEALTRALAFFRDRDRKRGSASRPRARG